jgi:dipeptidyl aminopeptidase/acylaminoacyl peptidase
MPQHLAHAASRRPPQPRVAPLLVRSFIVCALLAAAACGGGLSLRPRDDGAATVGGPELDLAVPLSEGGGENSIEQFMQILSASDPSRAPDGTLYYVTWTTGIDQLYRVPPGQPGATPELLTDFPDGIDFYSLAPDGTRAVLGTSEGGSEQSDLYLLDTATLRESLVVGSPEYRYEGVLWQADSSGFFFRANDENGTDFSIYYYDLDSEERRLVVRAPGWNAASDVSDDGNWLLVTRYGSNADSDVYLYELDEDSVAVSEQHLTPHDGDVRYHYAQFDGERRVWIVSDRERESMAVGILGDAGVVDYRTDHLWEVEGLVMSNDRRTIAYVTNEAGYGRLHLLEVATGDSLEVPEPAGGIVSLGEFDGDYLTLVHSSPVRTDDIWILDRDTLVVEQQTFSDYAGIDTSLFREPELIHIESFDGLMIPAFLYLPPTYVGGLVPTIIDVHGGPESQYRPSFNRHFQYLMLNGFAVVAPNVRGSSGYGPEFLALDNYRLRMNSVRDLGAVADWLFETGYADPEHLGIKGGSYGGFMVMAAITEMPERFAAACEIVGIVNFVTFLENTADYRRALREAEYGPLSDRAFLESISPIHRVDRITAPLLVIHGENDPRVPVGEARQVIEALRARGQHVESIIFPDEGHGVRHLENRLVMYRAMVDFFARHLGPEGAGQRE